MLSTTTNLWDRRHLLRMLAISNLKRQNRNSALGYLWWLLDPVLMTAVYYLVVAVLFQRGGTNQPFLLFVMCGLLSWKAFSDSINQSIGCIRGAYGIVKSISFPKAVLPLSLVVSNTAFFMFGMLVLVAMSLAYGPSHGTWPSLQYLWLPLVVAFQFLFTVGVSLFVATIGVLFVDTANIAGHVLRMWYFLSPGLYSLDQVPVSAQTLFRLNPFCGIMESYRDIIIYAQPPHWLDLGYAALLSLLSCVLGYVVFRSLEGKLVQKL